MTCHGIKRPFTVLDRRDNRWLRLCPFAEDLLDKQELAARAERIEQLDTVPGGQQKKVFVVRAFCLADKQRILVPFPVRILQVNQIAVPILANDMQRAAALAEVKVRVGVFQQGLDACVCFDAKTVRIRYEKSGSYLYFCHRECDYSRITIHSPRPYLYSLLYGLICCKMPSCCIQYLEDVL